jgi:hypothetical protein
MRTPACRQNTPLMGWGATLRDEDWIGLGGLKNDADYFDRVFMDTGVDLR